MAEMDNYEKMSQEQGLWSATGDGAEYVVRGAVVECSKGIKYCVLNLPSDYGLFTSEGRPKILSKDTKTANIKGFGTCGKGKNQKKCTPKLSDWQYVDGNDKVEINGVTYYAVSKNAKAQCSNGDGTVTILKSGQAESEIKNIDKFTNIISENNEIILQKYNPIPVANPSNATSVNEDSINDIFGIIQVEKTGVYTLNISISSGTSDLSVLRGIVLYAYAKSKNGLKYEQAYPLTFNEENSRASLDWLIDITYKYYFEIDWAYLSGVELKCNLTPYSGSMNLTLADKELGAYWIIDTKLFNVVAEDGWSCLHLQDTFDGSLKLMELYLNAVGEKEVSQGIAHYLAYEERFQDSISEYTTTFLNIAPTAVGLIAYLTAGTAAAVLSAFSMFGSVLAIIVTYARGESLEEKLLGALLDLEHSHDGKFVACKVTCYFRIHLNSVPDYYPRLEFVSEYVFIAENWDDSKGETVAVPQYLKGYSGIFKYDDLNTK